MDPAAKALIANSDSGVLPENKVFTEQFLKLSGMAQLRPPLKPAASGDDFTTIIPYQVSCHRTFCPVCTYSSAKFHNRGLQPYQALRPCSMGGSMQVW